jgi:hypothetical protein
MSIFESGYLPTCLRDDAHIFHTPSLVAAIPGSIATSRAHRFFEINLLTLCPPLS